MDDLEFRSLNVLLQNSCALVERFKRAFDSIEPNLCENFELTPNLAPEKGYLVISYLLEFACQCQNMLNIELGRAGLLSLPQYWLLQNIKKVMPRVLNLDDEWEYRRLLEVLWKIDKGLVREFTIQGLYSGNAEVRETARDSLDELNIRKVPLDCVM